MYISRYNHQPLMKRSLLTGIVLFAGAVFGFIVLIRSCLAKYDERSAISPVLYFEQPEEAVLFSLVEFEKTTSYSQKGGMTRRSVSSSYYIQTNDAITGEKKASKKIKKRSQVKEYPIEVMGSAGNLAWVFVGEPMAFNPFTLEKKADRTILENANPVLKGRFPAERRYYRFSRPDQAIFITATDGSFWKMDAVSFRVEPYEEGAEDDNPVARELARLKELEENNRAQSDTLYRQKNKEAVEKFRRREIDEATYMRISKEYYAERDRLGRVRDSLQRLIRSVEQDKDNVRELFSTVKRLNEGHQSFSSIKYNADTLNGRWYGLYARDEEKELTSDYFYYRNLYKETARRQFYSAAYTASDNGRRIKKQNIQKYNDYFLDGGLLVSNTTGKPEVSGEYYFVVHKNMVGKDGLIQLSLVHRNGSVKWTMNSTLKEWAHWIVTAKRMYVTGRNTDKLSSNQVNLLLVIDLATGGARSYDYMTDK